MKTYGVLIPTVIAMLAVSYIPSLADVPLILVGLAISVALILLIARCCPRVLPAVVVKGACNLGLGACMGGTLAYFLCQNVLHQQFPAQYSGDLFELSGHIVGIPTRGPSPYNRKVTQWRFDLLVNYARPIKEPVAPGQRQPLRAGQKIQLVWYSQQFESYSWVQPGQAVTLSAKLKSPRGLANPGGFDYQRWLLSSGYSAVGVVKTHLTDQSLGHSVGSALATLISKARWRVRQRLLAIQQSSPERDQSQSQLVNASLLAIALGDKSLLSDGQWQQLRDTGTIHLLIVSGMHISIVAGIGFFLGGLLAKVVSFWRPRYWLGLATAGSVGAAIAYAALAGFSLPTQRALVMVVVANLFWLFGFQRRPWLGYWLAMMMVLCLDPLSGHSGGFWLSFTVVGVILLLLSQANRASVWARSLSLQARIFFAMLLPIALVTGVLNLVSPIANLLAIPYVSFLLVPVTLTTALFALLPGDGALLEAFFELARILVVGFWRGLDWFGPDAVWLALWPRSLVPQYLAVEQISWWQWLGLLLLTLAAIFPIFPLYYRLLSFTTILVATHSWPINHPVLKLTVLDVGQGASHVIQFGRNVLVFDTGPQFSQDFQAATDIVQPMLLRAGADRIETLVLSHGDADHASGVRDLAQALDITDIESGEPERLDVSARQCRAGQRWQWRQAHIDQALDFQYLWPSKDTNPETNSNDRSCVLLLQWGDQRILLTGDISKRVEWLLSAEHAQEVDVLIAPHHGSITSSSHRFIAGFEPRHVVFSTGFDNRFGHPNDRVMSRYKELSDAVLWNTAQQGAIVFEWDKHRKLSVHAWRSKQRRFWY